MKKQSTFRSIFPWLIYPVSWLILIGYVAAINHTSLEASKAYGFFLATMVISYLILERLLPYEKNGR